MEITRKNFAEELENITNNLKRSCFVGFDAEFTALLSGECFKYRLFDTNEQRYDKIKDEVSKMIISQVGLTMFQYDRNKNDYNAVGYTFHLCPQVLGDIDQSFIFQASTLKFLCKHNFNFNKFIYEGIPYLSKVEEDEIVQQIKNNNLTSYLTSALEIEEEKELQYYSNKVSEWLHSSEDGTMYIDVQNPIQRYLIHTELRQRFPNILTTDSLGNSNKILIYRDKSIEGANSAKMETLEKNLIDKLLGFSNIIQLLVQYKKPIIGHNIFMDLLLLHNQFIGPLPKKYSIFKMNINNLFPVIYDTKYISHEMGKKLTLDEVWQSNILQDLHEFFAKGKYKKLQNGINFITLIPPFNEKQSYHEAGWDSYCSGFCFIRLGQWAACDNMGVYRPVGPREKMAALAPYCNKVNVIRGATPYMCLDENDPPTHRPNLLHIKSLKERIMNIDKVACAVAGCGAADVRALGRRTALVAAGTHFTADKILKKFKDSREYRVSTYKPYGQSAARRLAIWSGALITGSLLLMLLHKRVKS
ncbi:Poly(A)-specific ribonuclease PARN-like domain-containing protein 1 [Papilio machaon]|uniref:Poly(A)-specific ribonuclease PARN-like domain-containing protein 1 n=1 Tax=Papilio machaon TaxID=76193 RepID=A0A194QL30_PAPMA|nr:Poly(A)-specific ribonuclease PARN-like domain-containing protein 1 [Papilio machaon]